MFILLGGKVINTDYVESISCVKGPITRLSPKEVYEKTRQEEEGVSQESYLVHLRSGDKVMISYTEFVDFQDAAGIT